MAVVGGLRTVAVVTAVLMAASCAAGSEPDEAAPSTTSAPETVAATFEPAVAAVPVAYPTQPDGVAWPTDGWQTGPIPAGVDAAAVETLLDGAFGEQSTGPSANYDAVVVVHAG